MPRNRGSDHDEGGLKPNSTFEDGLGSLAGIRRRDEDPSKRSNRTTHTYATADYDEDHPDLAHLEERLNEEVDEDFFEEPKKFHTLHRVIDVLGMQLVDDLSVMGSQGKRSKFAHVERNPAYRALKEQQAVVEEAIEHLAMIHCADLNGSVVQVGRVARLFHDAVTQVRTLRKQVREIQETLGAPAGGGNNKQVSSTAATAAAASAMSLRELWLKKLECEAVLSLLDKLDRIRAAPLEFDHYLANNRIGAAVLGLAQALDTMFSNDVAQVQALHKIMEQLMIRKQRAEEVVWELLSDVLFLRTGNGLAQLFADARGNSGGHANVGQTLVGAGGDVVGSVMVQSNSGTTTGSVVSTESNLKHHHPQASSNRANRLTDPTTSSFMKNPFLNSRMRFALDQDLDLIRNEYRDNEDDEYYDDIDEEEEEEATSHATTSVGGGGSAANQNNAQAVVVHSQKHHNGTLKRMMIPIPMMEAEFDLEADERRCLEEIALVVGTNRQARRQPHFRRTHHGHSVFLQHNRPVYADHVLAFRTLVECLARLRRLDDVDRIVSELLEKEFKELRQREQGRTYLRLERSQKIQRKTGRYYSAITAAARGGASGTLVDLRHFGLHLNGILSAYGVVMVRLSHLAQILRHRIIKERGISSSTYNSPSSALQAVLQSAKAIMEREVKEFLKACLTESEGGPQSGNDHSSSAHAKGRISSNTHETGLFTLGIIDKGERNRDGDNLRMTSTSASFSNVMEMSTSKFVIDIMFPKGTVNGSPQIRHALFFRKRIAKWTADIETLRKELAIVSGEDTSAPSYNYQAQEPAIDYLDNCIKKDLLPMLQEEAVNGTVQALERADAFDPVLDRNVYARANSNEPQDVDMCKACNALYTSTGPLFLALHRLPHGGEMYLPLVAVLEHVILTFISRVKQQVGKLCNDKTALQLLMDSGRASKGSATETSPQSTFGQVIERRRAFSQLLVAYADGDLLEVSDDSAARDSGLMGVSPLSPPPVDSPRNATVANSSAGAGAGIDEMDLVGSVEREEHYLALELNYVKPFVEFGSEGTRNNPASATVCTDEELMKAACLAHSLLKLSSLLESRLKVRSKLTGASTNKTLPSTRALREAIKTIKANGLKMAKICRADILMQTITRLSKVCSSSTIVARDAVRIPSSVNDLGEYLTAASDNLREAAGNAVTAYSFSNLEQYIPLCLIQTVRVLAAGEGIIKKAPLTMNGIESLDRSGSVLYRDLKGATSFDNSFWDVELAAVSFERSASFMAMMELEMAELEAYFQANRNDFSEDDFKLMFSMDGPRRKGDIGRYHMMIRHMK